MKKRIFSAFIALLTFIMTIPATAFAADNVIKLTSSATEVEPGEEFTLTLKLPEVENFNVFDSRLYFDKSKVEFVDGEAGNAMKYKKDLPDIEYDEDNNYVWIDAALTPGKAYDFSEDLCVVTFKALDGATGDLGFNLNVRAFSAIIDNEDIDYTYTTSVAKVTVKDNHVHTLTPTAAKAATCEEAGNIAYWTCSECGKIFSDENGTKEISRNDIVVPATDHAWDNGVVTTQPTCTEAGVRTFTCANDSTHKKTQPEPAAGHTLTAVAAKAATCEEEGNIAYYECSVCHKYFSDAAGSNEITDKTSVITPATNHNWGDWTVTTPATEESEGVETHICKNDASHKETRVIPKLNHVHVPVKVEAKAETCTEEGNIEYYTCSGCHKLFSDAECTKEISEEDTVVKAHGHKYNKWVITKLATCTEEGVKTWYCSYDETHTYTESVSMKDHTLTMVAAKAATCKENGNIAYYECSVCHKYFKDAAGSTEITDKTSVVVALADHTPGTPVEENRVEPTDCEVDGSYDEVVYCTVCKKELSRETKTIKAPGHDWDEGEITTPATCTEEGVKTFHCKNNNDHTKTEPVDKIAHTLTKVDAVPSTCKAEGNIEYYECSVCHKYFSDAEGKNEITDKTSVVVALADHTPGTPVEENRVEPTDCEVDGSYDEVVYCTVCKKELSRETKTIKAPGHDWDEGEITTPATCTEEGVKTFHCKNNNDHTKTEPVDKIAHTLTKVDAVPATCDVDGNTEYYECTVCHKYFSDAEGKNEITDKTSVIVPKAHTPGEPVEENRAEPADCVTDGSYDEVVYCTVCKKELSREAKTIKAPGHEWGEWETVKEATTTEPGSRKHSCKNCDAEETEEIPVISYSVSEQTWTKGSTDGALFTVNRSADDDKTFSLFDSAEVDGTKLTSDNYEAAAGSLKLVIKAAYLETLAEGDHTVKITFADGSAETKLVVEAKPAVDDGNSGNGNNEGNTDTGNIDTGNTDNGNTGSGNTDTDKPGNGGSDGNGGSGNPDTGSAAAAMSIVTVLAAAAIVLKKKK